MFFWECFMTKGFLANLSIASIQQQNQNYKPHSTVFIGLSNRVVFKNYLFQQVNTPTALKWMSRIHANLTQKITQPNLKAYWKTSTKNTFNRFYHKKMKNKWNNLTNKKKFSIAIIKFKNLIVMKWKGFQYLWNEYLIFKDLMEKE